MSTPFTELAIPINELTLVCRGCLADSGEMKNMYDWGLSEEYFKFTNVPIQKSDGISELLCTSCEETLQTCKRFKTQCQRSDILLRDTVKKKNTTNSTEEQSKENTISYVFGDTNLIIMVTAPDTESKIHLCCPYHCQDRFIKKTDLLQHMLKCHNTSKDFDIHIQFYCSVENCSYHINSEKKKWFSGRKFLNQHINKIHRSKVFQCASCNESYSKESDYNRHLKTCSTIFKCEVCANEYKTNDRLLTHLLRKHPDVHKQYKIERKAEKRKAKSVIDTKKVKTDERLDFLNDSPKRSFATQTRPEDNIKNDVSLAWQPHETKRDEISTQTVFEDLLSLRSQNSEDESIFFSETVSLSDIQTQTFPMEFGLSRSNKETITSETQSPDLSIKETQTCYCLYESPRFFESVSSSPSSMHLTSTETQTLDLKCNVKSDVLLGFNSAETQTHFDKETL